MNRYQEEVIGLDRGPRPKMRFAKVVGFAVVTLIVLWAAGIQPQRWWNQPTASSSTRQQAARLPPNAAPTPAPAFPKPSEPRKPLAGLSSSTSPEPQRLYLVSTAPGRNATQGTARLGTRRENPQTYAAGAMLVNGARLKEIYSDRVVLERSGKRATLYLSTSMNARIEGTTDLAMVGGSATAQAAPTQVTPAFAIDPFVEVVRTMPFYENEVVSGVQVFPGRQSAVFAALGLLPNDVIVAVDGAPVSDASATLERLRTLGTGTALTVTARRGSEIKQIALDGAVLVKAQESGSPLPAPDMRAVGLPQQ